MTHCPVDKRFVYRISFGAFREVRGSSLGPVIRSPEFLRVFTQALQANVTKAPQSVNKLFFRTAFQSINHPTITDSAAKLNRLLRSPVVVQSFHFVTEFSKWSLRNSCSPESAADWTPACHSQPSFRSRLCNQHVVKQDKCNKQTNKQTKQKIGKVKTQL